MYFTLQACHKTCYQRNVIEECGCADPYVPSTGQAFGDINGNVDVCDPSNATQGVYS